METPTTMEVLSVIGNTGIIVGSWPKKRDDAKDIDLVVKARKGRYHPLFDKLLKSYPDACKSSFMGHLWVDAVPMDIEIFESNGTLPPDDPEKRPGCLTYGQALRRSSWIKAYGITMRAVLIPPCAT